MFHDVRLNCAQSPIHIRCAFCADIHESTLPINTINWRTQNDIHAILLTLE